MRGGGVYLGESLVIVYVYIRTCYTFKHLNALHIGPAFELQLWLLYFMVDAASQYRGTGCICRTHGVGVVQQLMKVDLFGVNGGSACHQDLICE